MITVALICFDNPFCPPSEGGKKSIFTRIESLSALSDCKVDVYLMTKRFEKNEDIPKEKFPNCTFYQYYMNPTYSSLFCPFPICVNKRYCKDCANELSKHKYDFAIYEGEQVSKYRFKNCVQARRHILYFHDIESIYRSQISLTSKMLTRKIANRIEAKRFRWVEKRLYDYFDAFWFVSSDDERAFSSTHPKPCYYLPYPVSSVSDKISSGKNSKSILYVGDLSLDNNLSSLKWFISEVFPIVRLSESDAELEIIGRISEVEKKKLENSHIHILGYVDSLEKYYDESAMVIAPVLVGAGVKVKVIDSLAKGQIIATTSKGIEGTELVNGKHLFVSDDPQEQANFCINVLHNRKQYISYAVNGLNYVRSAHTVSHQSQLIAETFATLQK